MPLGLRNASSTFQRGINILSGAKWRTRLVNLDDIIIFSSSFELHTVDVAEVLNILKEANVHCHPRNCQFLQTGISFLGHEISPGCQNFPPRRAAQSQKRHLRIHSRIS
jgi:hypothetical protein